MVDSEQTVSKSTSYEVNSEIFNGAAKNISLSVWNSSWTRSHNHTTKSNLVVCPSNALHGKYNGQMSRQSKGDHSNRNDQVIRQSNSDQSNRNDLVTCKSNDYQSYKKDQMLRQF